MPQSNRSLRAKNLIAGWSRKSVVEGIDLELKAGEILTIAGPNGAGKSTILKVLARQLRPLSGQVLLGGQDVWKLPPKQFARQVAYLPQMLEPGQDLTVQELVALGRNPHQAWWSWHASSRDNQAIQQALAKTQTLELRHKPLSSLSGGEKQRAMIACALAQQPHFMLLDEPTAHLDFRHQLELIDLLKELRLHNLGVIVVLHDLNLIARVSDRILLLEKQGDRPSRVACCDQPAIALQPARLRQVYQVEISVLADPSTGQAVYTPAACTKAL